MEKEKLASLLQKAMIKLENVKGARNLELINAAITKLSTPPRKWLQILTLGSWGKGKRATIYEAIHYLMDKQEYPDRTLEQMMQLIERILERLKERQFIWVDEKALAGLISWTKSEELAAPNLNDILDLRGIGSP